MAQPNPYIRKYDLTNQDGLDLRTQLDVELDDVARCFLETLTNLALIQRDDGQVANASIGVEQLKAELIAGFNPPEPFQPYRPYEVADSFVVDDGRWFIVNTAFTSTTDPDDNINEITLVYDFASVRVDSINARDAAQAAQAAAELARDQAQTAAASASDDATQTAQDRQAAANSASSAANSASSAANSANAASTSASNAAAAEAAAEAAFDDFDDRYLGQKASPPTTDNDGNALLVGAMYWNTSAPGLYVWDGGAWQANDVVALTQDASNVGVNTSTGDQTLVAALNQRVVYVDTLADLEALDTGNLAAGQIIRTSGLLSVQDGGGRQYRITNQDPGQDNAAVSLGAGLWAALEKGDTAKDEVFGACGVRTLIGGAQDAHYGLRIGWDYTDSGKILYAFRKAPSHGVSNQGEVWVAESLDRGQTLINVRKIADNAGVSDMRVQPLRRLANNRFGFLVNRFAEDGTDYDPILFYTDDPDANVPTWNQKALVRPVGSEEYSFDAHAGILDYPASQGGNDAEGFIAFGFISAGGYGYLYTTDNFETYAWQTTTVAEPEGVVTALSEMAIAYIGSDRWLVYARNQDAGGWRQEAACWTVTNLSDWGTIKSSGVTLGGNPPALIYDEDTNKVHFFAVSRNGRAFGIFDNNLTVISADADELWTANGDFSAITGATQKSVIPLPDWGTGYFDVKKMGAYWWASFCAAERQVQGVDFSVAGWMGDFIPSGRDVENWSDLNRRHLHANEITVRHGNNDADSTSITVSNRSNNSRLEIGHSRFDRTVGGGGEYVFDIDANTRFTAPRMLLASATVPYSSDAVLHIPVESDTKAAITTETGSGQTRTHYFFRNTNGVSGSITTASTSTAYNTTSDGRLKTNRRPLVEELDIDTIVEGLSPLAYEWLDAEGNLTGDSGHGLVAQECESIYPPAVTRGRGEPGDADFSPWSVDYSKLVVILLAKVKTMDERIRTLEGKTST